MVPKPPKVLAGRQNWLKASDFKLDDLQAVLAHKLKLSDLTFADDIQQQVPLYDGPALLAQMHADTSGEQSAQIQSEWQWVWPCT